ncbi:MAG: hypothetical protein ISS28_03675 [Candidatus Cloacimonetes bacterium]|nr:hypothetical protein [Candidatus Cloacimonadota bacterium]MBL7086192.1 hypothetical protein [Candidatus Cloacimonadota bacterium]
MNQLFFKINLNKYGELREQIKIEKKTFRVTIITFFLITILLYIFVILLNHNLNGKMKSRQVLLSDIKKEIKEYQVSGEYLSSKDLERLAKISTERIFWAKKLVALSEKTTDKIAITHFAFKNDILSLYGITKLDKEQKEFDLIDEFITELKKNKHISSDFPGIKFVKSRRDFEKDVEILRFQIDCFPKDYGKKGAKT